VVRIRRKRGKEEEKGKKEEGKTNYIKKKDIYLYEWKYFGVILL